MKLLRTGKDRQYHSMRKERRAPGLPARAMLQCLIDLGGNKG
jgi:hypothetical protein